jgi:hypothetical protein
MRRRKRRRVMKGRVTVEPNLMKPTVRALSRLADAMSFPPSQWLIADRSVPIESFARKSDCTSYTN